MCSCSGFRECRGIPQGSTQLLGSARPCFPREASCRRVPAVFSKTLQKLCPLQVLPRISLNSLHITLNVSSHLAEVQRTPSNQILPLDLPHLFLLMSPTSGPKLHLTLLRLITFLPLNPGTCSSPILGCLPHFLLSPPPPGSPLCLTLSQPN